MFPSPSLPGPRGGARTPSWLLTLGAFCAGAMTVLGFAPFSWFPLALIALVILNEALADGTPRAGFWRGYAFGVGLLAFGVFWVRISLNEFGNMDAWVAHLMTALFIAAMALYYALAGWLSRRLPAGPAWTRPLLLLPGLYVLFEWLRGWVFTGFPWLNLGYTQIDGPLAGFAPIVGVYGLSLLTALSGGLLWGLLRWGGRARLAAVTGLGVIWLGGFALQQVEWTRPLGAPFTATVIQANIPQATKWDPQSRAAIMDAYVDLTLEHLDSDLILWPETAIPEFLHQVRELLIEPLGQRARESGAEIVIGIPVLDLATERYYNGLVSMGSREDLYTKRHLVPFGEFMPFSAWLGPLVTLFEVPMSDFSAGTAARPLLRVGERIAGASICYEDAFPAETAQALPDAQFLVNVSNDAWFGDSLAPHQHLEMARMRALESGRAMVRATNTGISAIIDWRGRVVGRIPSFVRETLTAPVQPRAGATPYVRLGNWLPIGLAFGMVALGALIGRRGTV